MVVRTQSKGRAVSGLLLAAEDVQLFFPERTSEIEIQLGELRIQCDLNADFWSGRHEITDRRLCEWLEFRAFHGRPCRMPLSLEMTPAGPGSFRLQPPAGCELSTCSWPEKTTAGCLSLSAVVANPPFEMAEDRGPDETVG